MRFKEMPLPKKLCILLLTVFLMLNIVLFPSGGPVSATELNGIETFYFTDYLALDGFYDSFGMFPAVSTEPSTSTNDSYYPPRIADFTSNQEDLFAWFTYWTFAYLGIDDLMFPHPLRIIESYEHTGQQAVSINGNIEFNLDFSTDLIEKMGTNNQVNVTIYLLNRSKPIYVDSTVVPIQTSLLSSVKSQTIIIDNVNTPLIPGDSILFSIEIIPSDRTISQLLFGEDTIISPFIDTFSQIIFDIVESIDNPTIQETLMVIEEIQNMSDQLNFSKEDIADVFNAIVCPSLIYDSVNHEATVSVPFSTTTTDENSLQYYFKENNQVSTDSPTGETISVSLSDQPLSWDLPSLSRSKILSSAQARLYIDHKDYQFLKQNMDMKVSLLKNNIEIASNNFTLDKTLSLTTTPTAYYVTLPITGQGIEIEYDSSITAQIELMSSGTISQGPLRNVALHYGGANHPSSLSLSFTETDHITVSMESDPPNAKIIAGDTVSFNLSIKSEFQDEVVIEKSSEKDEEGFWDVTISPSSISLNANQKKTVQVLCLSTRYALDAYDQDPLEVDIEIIGNTGYVTTTLTAAVSDEAVTYSTLIESPSSKKVQPGTNHTFIFSVKNNNTGLWPNSYIFNAFSEENFTVDIDQYTFDDLGFGNISQVNVTVHIPNDTDIKSDTVWFNTKSKKNGAWKNVSLDYTISSRSENADVFGFFESIAKDLGLEDSFGDFAPFVIPIMLIILVFIILIIMVFLFTSNPLKVTCIEKQKEINALEPAQFSLGLRNRLSKKQLIDIDVGSQHTDQKWKISAVDSPVVLLPKESKQVMIQIKPEENMDIEDHGDIDVLISSSLLRKPIRLNLQVVLKDGESQLSIHEVSHWPPSFRPLDKVSTSFKLLNHASYQTKRVQIKMYINGKEKNKVEDIIIPARGYAEIQIPWIAEKGKNHISLIVT